MIGLLNRPSLLLFIALSTSAAYAQTPGLLDRISTPERTLSTQNQALTGTWMLELRRPGQTILTAGMVTFLAEGTCIGPTADGTTSPSQGAWIRVADRKFLQTMYLFSYDEKRVLTTINKVRIAIQLSVDGQTIKGATEAVVLDREGKEMATIPGGSFTGVRLTVEKPADFDAFLNSSN